MSDSEPTNEPLEKQNTTKFQLGKKGGPGRRPGQANTFTQQFRQDVMAAYRTQGGAKWLAKLKPEMFAKLLMHVVPANKGEKRRILELQHTVGGDVLGAIRALLDQQTPAARTAIDVESRPVGLLPEPPQAGYNVAEQVQQDTPEDVQAVAGEPEDDESVGQCAPDEPTE